MAVGKEGSVGQRAVDESAADGESVAGEGAMAADAGAERRASAVEWRPGGGMGPGRAYFYACAGNKRTNTAVGGQVLRVRGGKMVRWEDEQEAAQETVV